MKKTKIEWCDSTWNPVTGCRHGCEYCYARAMTKRFPNTYPNGFEPTFYEDRLNQFDNCQRRNIFVSSMGDLFGDFIPDEWIEKVLDKCEQNQQHNYLFLTKNPERYWDILMGFKLPENIWLGTTVTGKTGRFKDLPRAEAVNTFISIEHLLNDIPDSEFERMPKWVIIGAETGRRKNKVIPKKEWIDKIVKQCHENNIPVFMKNSLIPIVGEENMLREFPESLRK